MPDPETETAAQWNSSSTQHLSIRSSMDLVDIPDHGNSIASDAYDYKLFKASSDSDDESPKKPYGPSLDKLQVDDDTDEHKYLISNINETISCNRELPSLYARIERVPHLFLLTFLNSNINGMLGIKTETSNTLVFSVLNLIRNESIMKRALEPALSSELNGVRTPAELLRNNSQTTRLMTLCTKALGQNIIFGSIQPIIRQVLDSELTFEIDPIMEPRSDLRKRNLQALCDTTADLLKRVLSDIPQSFASICRITYDAIEAKFPKHGWIGISNLLFLRFVCSSILVPASGSTYSSQQKRNLVLLAKLVQSAASLRKFDAKETFMQSTNKFLTVIIPQLSAFYKTFERAEQSDVDSLSAAARSYLVVRKISSLTRIAEYLDKMPNHQTALALTNGALTARIAYHHGFRRIIFSALHDCIFMYDEPKQQGQKSSPPLERYPIERIEPPVSTVNGVLVIKIPEPVRLQFTDDEECNIWRHRIESQIQS